MYWCQAESRRKVKSDIVGKIWLRFKECPTVEIAYPHLELEGNKGYKAKN
jgi:hypothetical protein